MRIIYVAHPIGGAVQENIKKVEAILSRLLHSLSGNSFPIAPYLDACRLLDDSNREHRDRAIFANYEYFKRGLVDELWVYGAISLGVRQEIAWADQFKIPVKFFISVENQG